MSRFMGKLRPGYRRRDKMATFWEIREYGSVRIGIVATYGEILAMLRWYLCKGKECAAFEIDLETNEELRITQYIPVTT